MPALESLTPSELTGSTRTMLGKIFELVDRSRQSLEHNLRKAGPVGRIMARSVELNAAVADRLWGDLRRQLTGAHPASSRPADHAPAPPPFDLRPSAAISPPATSRAARSGVSTVGRSAVGRRSGPPATSRRSTPTAAVKRRSTASTGAAPAAKRRPTASKPTTASKPSSAPKRTTTSKAATVPKPRSPRSAVGSNGLGKARRSGAAPAASTPPLPRSATVTPTPVVRLPGSG